MINDLEIGDLIEYGDVIFSELVKREGIVICAYPFIYNNSKDNLTIWLKDSSWWEIVPRIKCNKIQNPSNYLIEFGERKFLEMRKDEREKWFNNLVYLTALNNLNKYKKELK